MSDYLLILLACIQLEKLLDNLLVAKLNIECVRKELPQIVASYFEMFLHLLCLIELVFIFLGVRQVGIIRDFLVIMLLHTVLLIQCS